MYSPKGELSAFHTRCLFGTKDLANRRLLGNFTGSSRAHHRMEFQSKQRLGVTCDHRQSICPELALDKALRYVWDDDREMGKI